MPETAAAEPQAPKTETYADFKSDFDKPASAATADVEVNAHGVDDKTASAALDKEQKPADGSDPSQQQDKIAKRKEQIQREIDAQVARRETAKREADAEEARLQKLRGGEPSPKKDSAAQAAAAKPFDGTDASDPEPKQNDFTDYQQWQDARAAWIGRKEFRKLENAKTQKAAEEAQAREREAAQANHKTAVSDFETRGNEYAAEHDDYPELVAKFKETKISNETEAFLLWGCEGSEGPEILHRLMKEPEKLKEIDSLKSPIARFNALYAFKYASKIADLEKQLSEARPTPAERKKSSAPPAGTNVRASGAAAAVTVDNAPSYSSFKKAWDKSS